MFTRKPLITISAFVIASALPLTAFAFFPHTHYDLNNDGQVTQAEVQTARTAEFTQIDQNSNGFLSFAELQTWIDQQKTVRFNELDTDQNGSLSEAEFVAGKPSQDNGSIASRVFKLIDTNSNGALSLEEFKVLGGLDHLIHLFAHLDTDGDGQISNAEYLSAPLHAIRPDKPATPPQTPPTGGRPNRR